MERFALTILPYFGGMVAVLDEDGFGNPILLFLWQKRAALEYENTLTAWSKAVSECPPRRRPSR